MLKIGVSSKLLLQKQTKNVPNSEVAEPLKPKITKIKKAQKGVKKILKEFKLYSEPPLKEIPFVWKRSSNLEMFSYPESNYDITQSSGYEEADIINLHWVANFLDYSSFFKKNEKPVVWTLHDMNPFSGGEHYTELFKGIDESGYPIKRILSDFEEQEFKAVIERKKEAIKGFKNLTVVAPSQWLANEARKSEVFKGRPVHCIPYGLDPKIFAPRDKAFSRELLSIPAEKKMVLFVADSTSIPRKGFSFLKKALQKIEDENILLCAIGSNNSEIETDKNIIQLGSITDERLMSVAYSAADLFVIPSIMDNLPNTVIESLMCGTPVIGFPIGGISDMIIHEENGLLTRDISVDSLVEALNKFLAKPKRFNREKIRMEALKIYDEKIQAENYKNLFKKILKG
ncbi:glycosyltransferase [Salegentibacter lacus]|uniref:glycosyltransferase n=1 Tax=Salegentibacter lacus TaxID=2873599 RepID=UPI001F2AF4CE